MILLLVLNLEIWSKIYQNGSHFECMPLKSVQHATFQFHCCKCVPSPSKHRYRHPNNSSQVSRLEILTKKLLKLRPFCIYANSTYFCTTDFLGFLVFHYGHCKENPLLVLGKTFIFLDQDTIQRQRPLSIQFKRFFPSFTSDAVDRQQTCKQYFSSHQYEKKS